MEVNGKVKVKLLECKVIIICTNSKARKKVKEKILTYKIATLITKSEKIRSERCMAE